MYPMKNVQAVLLIFADVELYLRIFISGEGLQNFFRYNFYGNQTLLLTSCDCIYVAVWFNGIDQVENELVAKFFKDIDEDVLLQLFLETSMLMEQKLVYVWFDNFIYWSKCDNFFLGFITTQITSKLWY